MVSGSGNSCPNVCARPPRTKRATSPLILTDTKVPGIAVHHRSVSCGSPYSSLGDAAGREPIPVRRAPPRRWEAVRHPALRGVPNKLRLSASECWGSAPCLLRCTRRTPLAEQRPQLRLRSGPAHVLSCHFLLLRGETCHLPETPRRLATDSPIPCLASIRACLGTEGL